MKKWYKVCPFCANEIKEWAIKCKFCGEFLEKGNEDKREVFQNKTLYIYFWIVLAIIAVIAFLLWRLWNNTNKMNQNILQDDSLVTNQDNSVTASKQNTNFDRDMECQKYVNICEEKRQDNIDANYYTTNWNKPTIWIFYSPIEDSCLCYYDTEITNYDWVYWQWKYHYSAVITDAFKEWSDPTRKTAIYEDTPSEWTRCKWYSAYQWMTSDDMKECPYANTKSSFLEEVSRLKWE